MNRRGSLLILVAGLCSILAGLILTYAIRTRSATAEAKHLLNYGQARICLISACSYILEAGRIGWETDTYNATTGYLTTIPSARHEEAFGWIDVRDGFSGPKSKRILPSEYLPGGLMDTDSATTPQYPALTAERIRLGRLLTLKEKQAIHPSPNFPVGTIARFPLHVPERPPFAISPAIQNPILTPYSTPPVAITDSRFGEPLRSNPEPIAWNTQVNAGTPTTYTTNVADFRNGVPTPLPGTSALAWFRIYRDTHSTFVITCGAGATQGFRDWKEIVDSHNEYLFQNDVSFFKELLEQEVRLWYRIEWSPAIAGAAWKLSTTNNTGYAPGDDYVLINHYTQYQDSARWPVGISNACGTIQWVQRLDPPPLIW